MIIKLTTEKKRQLLLALERGYIIWGDTSFIFDAHFETNKRSIKDFIKELEELERTDPVAFNTPYNSNLHLKLCDKKRGAIKKMLKRGFINHEEINTFEFPSPELGLSSTPSETLARAKDFLND